MQVPKKMLCPISRLQAVGFRVEGRGCIGVLSQEWRINGEEYGMEPGSWDYITVYKVWGFPKFGLFF